MKVNNENHTIIIEMYDKAREIENAQIIVKTEASNANQKISV